MYRNPIFLFVVCSLMVLKINAQHLPLGKNHAISDQIKVTTLSNWHPSTHIYPDQKIGTSMGYQLDVAITPSNSGQWVTSIKGFKIWMLKLAISDAAGIGLVIKNLQLEAGEQIFIYNRIERLGPYNRENIPISGVLPVLLTGDEIIVELDIPENMNPGKFIIETVSCIYDHTFGQSLNKNSDSANPESCYTCLNGDFWKEDQRAVMRIIIFKDEGPIMCTGTLVNNTALDEKPYVLTAEHCISNQEEADRAVFTFGYGELSCNELTNLTNHTLLGSIYRASAFENDFSLVELYVRPPIAFQPYYAGWGLAELSTDQLSCIHHPGGGEKKISIANHSATISDYQDSNGLYRAPNSFWHVANWTLGVTQNGSSGAPLFNKNHQVIGTLTGGQSSCGHPYHDYFERLSSSWKAYPDKFNQLSHWLDPLFLGVTSIKGHDPFNNIQVSCDTITNIQTSEPTALITYSTGDGYYTGCHVDYDTFAEEFIVADSSLLTGITINVSSIQSNSEGGVVFVVHSANNGLPGAFIYEQYVPYSSMHLYLNYIEFYPFVPVNGRFFVSYTLDCTDDGLFALAQAEWRNNRTNTAYSKGSTGWKSMKEIHPLGKGTSIDMAAYVCLSEKKDNTDNTTSFDVYPNPVQFELVIKVQIPEGTPLRFQLSDLKGANHDITYNRYNDCLIIDVSLLHSGIYILNIAFGEHSFRQKFIKQ